MGIRKRTGNLLPRAERGPHYLPPKLSQNYFIGTRIGPRPEVKGDDSGETETPSYHFLGS